MKLKLDQCPDRFGMFGTIGRKTKKAACWHPDNPGRKRDYDWSACVPKHCPRRKEPKP